MFNLAPIIIQDELKTLSEQLAENQSAKGLKASGRSAKSLRISVTVTDTTIRGQIIGADYWYYQQNGRGPGKYAKPSRALVAAIREWIKQKGITAPAYAIAYKINRDGVRVPNQYNSGNVVTQILNAETASKAITPRLSEMVFNDIRTEILKPI